jgi:aldose 1-epimerase
LYNNYNLFLGELMKITKEPFGKTEGKDVSLFTLTNNNNITVKITNYGGIVTHLMTPDKSGKTGDIVLGFNTLDEYLKGHPYFGALIGRYGNRIGNAKFTLNGREIKLASNDGKNHLHGGIKGFDKVVWDAEPFEKDDQVTLKLSYFSKDGEENYPGNLSCTVKYILNNRNELVIEYEAKTDKTTVVNMTHHGYFNLSGEGSGDILDHEMTIFSDKFTASDETLLPTGEIKSVTGTALDFTKSHAIGKNISQMNMGYDNNYVLNKKNDDLILAAKAVSPISGRIMEVYTTQPGIQFYTGNFLDGKYTGKSGKKYIKHSGFCLETQHYPDSPNKLEFPTTVLNPGEIYHHFCVYKFST